MILFFVQQNVRFKFSHQIISAVFSLVFALLISFQIIVQPAFSWNPFRERDNEFQSRGWNARQTNFQEMFSFQSSDKNQFAINSRSAFFSILN